MKFMIMDRYDARDFCKEEHSFRTCIISISTVGGKANYLPKTSVNRIVAVLPLWFDDELCGDNAFDQDMAAQILRFVDLWKSHVDCILVHCDAGISRSAAVCAALKRYLGEDDWDIFRNPQYDPNALVYHTMMEQIDASYIPCSDENKFALLGNK